MKHAGADLEAVVLGLAAVEGDAVDEALEVEDYGVAVLHGALDVEIAGVALAGVGELGVYLLVGDGGLGVGDLEALVLAEGHDGIEVGGEGDGADLVLVDVVVGDGGGAHGVEALFLDGELKGLGGELLDGVVVEDVRAVHALDDHAGGLALAEAGDVYAVLQLAVGLVDGLLKGLGVYFDLEDSGVVVFLFYVLDDHGVDSSSEFIGEKKFSQICAEAL